MPKGRRRRRWWTKERVIEGLLRFMRDFKFAPTATEEYQRYQQYTGKRQNGVGNPYPSSATVLGYFASFRAAWNAAGIEVDRGDVPWTPAEEWFISEGAGLLSRVEMADFLGRTPDAVHRRLYDLGIDSRSARGWTVHRAASGMNVGDHVLWQYLERGEIPFLRGCKYTFLDPVDLLVVREVEWSRITPALTQAIRQSLMKRLVAILVGQDWRAASPYRVSVLRTTARRWSPAKQTPPAQPLPFPVGPGSKVRFRQAAALMPELKGRVGKVISIYFSRTKQSAKPFRRGLGPCWIARLEFPRTPQAERKHISIPVALLRVVGGKHEDQETNAAASAAARRGRQSLRAQNTQDARKRVSSKRL